MVLWKNWSCKSEERHHEEGAAPGAPRVREPFWGIVTEATSVILGALVGAAAGLGGGGFAALASLRPSQLAARAPLGPVLHKIGDTIIGMNATKGTSEYLAPRREFERRWSEFSIQQRILCPSERIANLMKLDRQVGRKE